MEAFAHRFRIRDPDLRAAGLVIIDCIVMACPFIV